MFIMGRLMGVSTVLLTTGTSGRDDLFKKFTEMLQGSNLSSPWDYVQPHTEFAYGIGQKTANPQLVRAPSSDQPRIDTLVLRAGTIGGATKSAWASEQMLRGACLVVNHSSSVRLSQHT